MQKDQTAADLESRNRAFQQINDAYQVLSNAADKERYDIFIGNLVAPRFEQSEASKEKEKESFYQRVLRKKKSEPIFEKEIDLDEEIRKLEQIKLNRQKQF